MPIIEAAGNLLTPFSGGAKLIISGGTLTTSGGYSIRTFTTVGTSSLNVVGTGVIELLVVAGGGGAGYDVGGAGGGGGLCYSASYPVSTGSYSVVVGGGGASLQTIGGNARGSNGENSSFGSVLAYGGGGGGSYPSAQNNPIGANGGSGGGGGDNNYAGGSSIQTSGTNYTGYGFAGGRAWNSSWGSGAGGGAGGVGADGTGGFVAGGVGRTYTISGSSVTYAGGGYGNADSGTIYPTGYNSSNSQLGYYGYGANGTGVPNASPYNGNPGIVIVRYLG